MKTTDVIMTDYLSFVLGVLGFLQIVKYVSKINKEK